MLYILMVYVFYNESTGTTIYNLHLNYNQFKKTIISFKAGTPPLDQEVYKLVFSSSSNPKSRANF
jgi:hypothetical protein